MGKGRYPSTDSGHQLFESWDAVLAKNSNLALGRGYFNRIAFSQPCLFSHGLRNPDGQGKRARAPAPHSGLSFFFLI